jgi:ABC-type glycerol-3-phosphate transport system substrate-binding protein
MEDDPSSHHDRRQVLATMAALASTTGIAGCSLSQDQTGVGDSGATDVIVHNIASESKTVSITITDTEAENPYTSRTLEVSPEEIVDPANSGKLPTNTSGYTVDVAVTNGPSETFEWTDPTVQLAPLWVQIDGTRNIVFLLQAG